MKVFMNVRTAREVVVCKCHVGCVEITPLQPGNRWNTLSLSMSTMGMEAPLSYCNNAAFSGRKTPGLLVQWLSPHGRITRVPRELEQAPPSRRGSLCRCAHTCGPTPRLGLFPSGRRYTRSAPNHAYGNGVSRE